MRYIAYDKEGRKMGVTFSCVEDGISFLRQARECEWVAATDGAVVARRYHADNAAKRKKAMAGSPDLLPGQVPLFPEAVGMSPIPALVRNKRRKKLA